jgi:predicted PurR-regulated permease PerM
MKDEGEGGQRVKKTGNAREPDTGLAFPRAVWLIIFSGACALALGLGFLGALWLLYLPIAVLAVGITIGEALSPPVEWLSVKMPRAVAVVLVYLVLLVLLAGIGLLIVPDLINQAEEVSARLPDLFVRIQHWLAGFNLMFTDNTLNTLLSYLSSLSSSLFKVPKAIFSTVVNMLIAFFVSIYWLIDAPALRNFFLSLFPEERRERVDAVTSRMGRVMGGYVRGAVIDGVLIGVATYIGLLIIGVNYPLVLSLIAGVLEAIPVIGPIVAAVPMLCIALLQSSDKFLITLIFMICLHQAEGHIVLPNIMYRQTEISPMLVLLALLAGGSIGGVLGIIIAIPLAAATRVFLIEVVAPAVRRRTRADGQGDVSGDGENSGS